MWFILKANSSILGGSIFTRPLSFSLQRLKMFSTLWQNCWNSGIISSPSNAFFKINKFFVIHLKNQNKQLNVTRQTWRYTHKKCLTFWTTLDQVKCHRFPPPCSSLSEWTPESFLWVEGRLGASPNTTSPVRYDQNNLKKHRYSLLQRYVRQLSLMDPAQTSLVKKITK